MSKPLDRWVFAGLVAALVIAVLIPVYIAKNAILGSRHDGAPVPPTFVGRETCAPCHEKATKAWTGSYHDRAMDVANDATVRGDFNNAVFEHDGIQTRFYRRDGTYYVYTEGSAGVMAEFAIAYVFGDWPLQQYLIPFPGGRLQSLAIAWDAPRRRWYSLYPDQRIPPSDWLHWTRNGQNWNGMCAECHSTNLVKGYDPATRTFHTTWSEIDVSCEACHGPGSRHVAWAKLPPMARPEVDNYELVLQTGNISARQQVELCAPCHSRRTELGDYDHTRMPLLDSYLPAVLSDPLYYADGQIREEVYVYGSFTQSKMFRNGVRCSDCHDVHSLKLLKEGNDLCTRCHRADTYDTSGHHFHKPIWRGKPSDGTRCVSCHMVQRPYMGIDWRADHSMRVPRPDLTLEIGVPNACTAAGCHDDQPLSWSLDAYRKRYGEAKRPHYGQVLASGRARRPEAREQLLKLVADPLHPAIVRATGLTLLSAYPGDAITTAFNRALSDEDALIRYTALASLNTANRDQYLQLVTPLLFDPIKAVRIEAAAQLAGVPVGMLKPYQREELDSAIAEYVRTMEHSLDFAFAGHNLGNLYSRLGDPQKAEQYYKESLAIDDLSFPAKVNLAFLYNSQGRNQEAERLLHEVVRAHPEQYDVAYSLGLLLAEMNRVADAVEFLGRASSGIPDHARAHYNYGLGLQQLGRLPDAEVALSKALALEPTNLDFQFALADHYLRRQRWGESLELAERMIATHPESPLGRQVQTLVQRRLQPQ